ncbi:MAG: Universal stress protein UspA [Tardiphaga sp.]|jgi:nucleotide-binding universal stress UspA family protein|nr:Universal stress protein UspA [Tardiphaga sp.]
MALKSLVVFVDPTPQGEARVRYAIKLAVQHEAHLIGVFIAPASWGRNPADAFVRGPVAIREMVERHNVEELATAAAALKSFETLAARERLSHEFRLIKESDASELVRLHSLHTDLIVSSHPAPDDKPSMASVDAMLMATGVPFLVVPDGWQCNEVATNVLFAWNASREARRAITDSLPLLRSAKSVAVVVIDSQKNASHGEQPGADVAHYLSRHGVKARVEERKSNGVPVADVIRAFAVEDGSDLIVLGAYSHARSREFIFGGVTRSLLKKVTIPMFLAH